MVSVYFFFEEFGYEEKSKGKIGWVEGDRIEGSLYVFYKDVSREREDLKMEFGNKE